MKKKIIVLIVFLMIIALSIVIYPVTKNNNYKKNMISSIYNNTDYKDITYLNKDNNYYIIKTKEKVVVLDLNYEEKKTIEVNKLKESNLELVYRRGSLYYEEKTKEEGKIIYKFYNVETGEIEYETSLGGV